jgi:hypothetical protein
MKPTHFEFLVEEPSMEAFLMRLLPKLIGENSTFAVYAYQGKTDLLRKLPARLRGYANWRPANTRIVVLVDRDDDDCTTLKRRLENDAATAGLATRAGAGSSWHVLNRIVIEELESWYFGEWAAVCRAFPRLSAKVVNKASYKNCDNIVGGTWEALEKILKRGGYFTDGLRKIEAAGRIGEHFDPGACVSPSFIAFRDALIER